MRDVLELTKIQPRCFKILTAMKAVNMSKLSKISALLVATTFITPALGADLLRGSIDVQEAAVSDWSGAYVGVGVGYGAFEDRDARFDAFFPGFVSKGDGFGLSAHVGYNFQLGNFVVGAEADITQLNEPFRTAPPILRASDLRINDIMTLRGRIGYDMDRFLPYVTAGVSRATTNIDTVTEGYGYAAGIGIDYKVTEKILFGVQYMRHEFEDFGGQPIQASFDLLTARLSAKF